MPESLPEKSGTVAGAGSAGSGTGPPGNAVAGRGLLSMWSLPDGVSLWNQFAGLYETGCGTSKEGWTGVKLLEDKRVWLYSQHSSSAMMWDMLAVLVITSVLPVVYHGWRAAMLVVVSMAACLLAYIFFQLVTGRKIWITDASPLITGAIIA